MAQHYDAGTKFLLKLKPQAWLSLLGLPVSDFTLLDTDLSTVTASADSAIYLLSHQNIRHLEFQSSFYHLLIQRSLFHNRLRNRETGLSVKTILILLHPKADSPDYTGTYTEQDEDGTHLLYRYFVLRVWEIPVETILNGDIALLPYAPLAKITRDELPATLETMRRRVAQETDTQTQAELWTATRILMGLKFNNQEIERFLRGVNIKMRESVSYQAILEEGRNEGRVEGRNEGREEGREEGRNEGVKTGAISALQETILRIGTKRFGPPSEAIQERVLAVTSKEELESLTERLIMVETWTEFFDL